MADKYHVTDGRNEREFEFTPEGLREAWDYAQTLHTYQLTNPNRVDLRADDSGLDDGLTDDERERLGEFEDEAYREQHADEIAEDAYWQNKIDEARGK